MTRKCKDCPAEVQAVCKYVFGRLWNDKSSGGEGCDCPLDDVAKAWAAKGWKPDERQTGKGEPVSVPVAGGVITLSRPANAPRMPTRPTRPKVSAGLARQAELFFGRAAK